MIASWKRCGATSTGQARYIVRPPHRRHLPHTHVETHSSQGIGFRGFTSLGAELPSQASESGRVSCIWSRPGCAMYDVGENSKVYTRPCLTRPAPPCRDLDGIQVFTRERTALFGPSLIAGSIGQGGRGGEGLVFLSSLRHEERVLLANRTKSITSMDRGGP